MDRSFILFLLLTHAIYQSVSNPTRELSDCNQVDSNSVSVPDNKFDKSLLIVSSLDGKISALEPATGKTLWTHATGPGPLLSSTISNIEIAGRGEWVQLIPSLDGVIYKYNGKTVEPIPVTAETLLRNSFKLGDDTVVTGGKESRTYGINLETGDMHYECTMDGCKYFGENRSTSESILLVKRETQTVRAIEPRSGAERWNFSVGEHHISFLDGAKGECHDNNNKDKTNDNLEDYCVDDQCFDIPDGDLDDSAAIKVIVPEGLVVALDSFTDSIVWSVRFKTPVVNAWFLRRGELQPVDIFDWRNIFYSPQLERDVADSPVLYIGSHNHQLYIQHSAIMKSKITFAINQYMIYSDMRMPQLDWNPDLIASASQDHIDVIQDNLVLPETERKHKVTSNAVILQKQIDNSYNHGYYLYDHVPNKVSDNTSICRVDDAPHNEEELETLDQIIIGSLWHWWKEVLGISVTMAVLLNLAWHFILKRMKKKLVLENSNSQPIQIIQPVSLVSSDVEDSLRGKGEEITPSSLPTTPNEYSSRFLADFESVQCLGKGGFGVVIEAKNKIDECSYAIKRICLPYREEAREKVMREVKALAKLDHPSIVRYYNSWLECPPPGWQEERDKVWECSEHHSVISNSPASLILKKTAQISGNNPLKPFDLDHGDSIGFVPRNNLLNRKQENNNSIRTSESESSAGVVFGYSGQNQDSVKSLRKRKHKNKESNHGCKQLPFEQYHSTPKNYQSTTTTNSFIAFEDSGCADKSQSTDLEEFECSSSNSFNNNLEKCPDVSFFSSKMRPSNLSISSCQSTFGPKLFLYIQMQLCRKETLKDWLNTNINKRERYHVLDIFDQIVSAVQYVHSCGLMHRDLKPSNIFFSIDGTIKVGDFGLVTALTENEAHTPAGKKNILTSDLAKHTDQVGTQLYMSPEQISGQPYSHKVDIYSLGLIFFELLVPFQTQMERINVLSNVKKHRFPEEFKKNQHEECKFVSQLLAHNPEKRPTAEEIKKHSLFKEFQPQPEFIVRQFRRRTLSQRFSSSSSDEVGDTSKALEVK